MISRQQYAMNIATGITLLPEKNFSTFFNRKNETNVIIIKAVQ